MTEVTLSQILSAREERAKKQKEILGQFSYPLIFFTMNIAGPIKTSPLIERSFYEGIKMLKERLPEDSIIWQNATVKETGPEAMFSVREDSVKLKRICTLIEDSSHLGRLFDLDVLTLDGIKLERENLRGCLVCGAPGRNCAAGRLHSVSKLQSATKNIMESYFFDKDREFISFLAVKSLLDEVYTTPKPGLVDCRNNGSHRDMNTTLFEKSANSLKSYFAECFSIGKTTKELAPDKVFPKLKKAGIAAENAMYRVTGGVNTHKGAIYSMGLLCAGAGRLWRPEGPLSSAEDICLEGAKIAKKAAGDDFKSLDASTRSGKLYIEHGITGIRGEVISGFSSVLKISLPVLKKLINNGFAQNDAGTIALLHLISRVKDTNLYHRGGICGAEYAEKKARELINSSIFPTKEHIEALDDDFIRRNLSPGGCADLLAVTYFLYNLNL